MEKAKFITNVTNRMGGAQLATITFLAPTSLAICTISLDVVPRTIESIFLKKEGSSLN
jgi:hypothetical protein